MKEDIVRFIVSPYCKEKYLEGSLNYSFNLELECPECGRHYFSIYGNRFNKDGTVKNTLCCKSCSSRRVKLKNADPEPGTHFGDLAFLKRVEDRITVSGKHYIQYQHRCKYIVGSELF